jgi:hypothetical protein
VLNLPISIILYVLYTDAAHTSLLTCSIFYYTVFNLPISIILYILYTDAAHTSLLASSIFVLGYLINSCQITWKLYLFNNVFIRCFFFLTSEQFAEDEVNIRLRRSKLKWAFSIL